MLAFFVARRCDMLSEDFFNVQPLQNSFIDEIVGTPRRFLRGLEYENDFAGDLLSIAYQNSGSSQQDRRMNIMATVVHEAIDR